jgi:hypothetical protein
VQAMQRRSVKTTRERPATIASGMTDLFWELNLPEGFRYIPGVLSRTEEASFVQRFEKLPLKPFEFHGYLGKRRIFTFGHKYVFAGQERRADASIPVYFSALNRYREPDQRYGRRCI